MKALSTFMVIVLALTVAIVAGCERKIVQEVATNDQNLAGCFACHGETALDGAILQAAGEWNNSIHASGTSVDYTNRDGSDCMQCHDHQGFIDFWTEGEIDSTYPNVSAIHCFTCHAPHTRGNMSLRIDDPYTLKNGVVFNHGAANLCVRCHHSRTALASDLGTADSVTLSSRFGPHHGPQGDMLQGTHGFEGLPGFVNASTTHATQVPDGCIGCHMGNPRQHDGYNVGGHSVNMEYEAHDGTTYTLIGVCAVCHTDYGASTVTDFDGVKFDDFNEDGTIDGVQTEFDKMFDTLTVLLAPVINSATGLLKSKKVSKLQAGAVYNYVIFKEDRSHGIHNPKYFAALLKSSIAYLKANPIPAS